MTLRPKIASSTAGFLFDPATGDSYGANALAADILARYDVAPAQLEKDWNDLLAQMRDFNLLDPAA